MRRARYDNDNDFFFALNVRTALNVGCTKCSLYTVLRVSRNLDPVRVVALRSRAIVAVSAGAHRHGMAPPIGWRLASVDAAGTAIGARLFFPHRPLLLQAWGRSVSQ